MPGCSQRDEASLIKQVWSVLHPGLALAALLGAPACAHRPPPTVAAAPAPDQAVTLPAQLNGKAFFVEVAVGDRGPFRFWLDTGASWTVLTPRLADELAAAGLLQDVADGRVATAAGQRQRYDFRQLTELRLAGYRVPEAMAFVTDLTALNRALGTNFDGVLGMELFRSGQLILDYRGGRLEFAPADVPAPSGSVKLPCRYEAYTPVIELVVGSKRTPMLIDSGADAGFYLPQRTKAAHFRSRPVVVSHAVTAAGMVERRAARLAHDLEFGGLRFETPTVTMTPAGFGLIGADVLRHFTLGFNPSRGEIWLLPSGDRNSVTFRQRAVQHLQQPIVITVGTKVLYHVAIWTGGLRYPDWAKGAR